MNLRRLAVLSVIPLVASCGFLPDKVTKKEGEPNPFGPTGIPPELRGRSEGTAVRPGGNVGPSAPVITPDEDMVFTNPDDPDAGIPELSAVLGQAKKGVWEESESAARRRSYREGKPLLIYFGDSRSNPLCKALEDEVFARKDFGEWAEEKLVRLKVDANTKVDADTFKEQEELSEKAKIQYQSLRARYKVLGQPAMVVLNPSGEVVGRYRGYKRGQADFTWGQLKHAEAVSTNANSEWRKRLSNQGYREWQDTKGRKVFAKLVSYQKGELYLVEPDGLRSKTHENRLSEADRDWIRKQKELRGIR